MVNRMRKLLLVVVCVVFAGCQTIYTWDKGYPPDGKTLTHEQKLENLEKFSIQEIKGNKVVVNGVDYTRESYAPIFRHVTPGILKNLARGDRRYQRSIFAGALATKAVTSGFGSKIPPNYMLAYDIAFYSTLAASFGIEYYAAIRYEEARDIYQVELRRRLGLKERLGEN